MRRQPIPTTKLGTAARLPHFYGNWQKVTSNKLILNIVKNGYKLQFFSPPVQAPYAPRTFTSLSLSVTKNKVEEFLHEGALIIVKPSSNQFLSHIFPVPKRTPGEFRIILDLSDLNMFIRKLTFRMDSYISIMSLISRGDFFISIDLTDAYHAIAIHPYFRRFLTFIFLNVYYQFTCLPQGLTSSPRIFTKVMKTVLSYFRRFAIKIAAWLDDFLLAAGSADLASKQASFALRSLEELGFVPNLAKSQLVPVQKIHHVGLVWDSLAFTVSIPEDKILDIQAKCREALSSKISLRFLCSILGSMEFFRWGCPIVTLHYRALQRNVNFYISRKLSYNFLIFPSDDARSDLEWWVSHSSNLPPRSLSPFSADIILFSDASNSGWGAWTSSDSVFGKWSLSESKLHINFLELKSVYYAFLSLFRTTFSCSILVRSDNSTVVSYLNKQGGTCSKILCDLALDIWNFCVIRNICIKATHIAGELNTQADRLSRLNVMDHDYSLFPSIFSTLSNAIPFPLKVDLFASHLNYKISNFISWHNDPYSSLVNAFSFKWSENVYIFPPIPLIDRVLNKFENDKVINGLLICPYWPSKSWFPRLLDMLIDFPLIIPESSISDQSRMLPRSCLFLGWPIGSVHAQKLAFREKLLDAPSEASQQIPWLGINDAGESSVVGVVKRKLVTALLM